jgi:DNA-directed RNA polymerase specialized sigma24 family protein
MGRLDNNDRELLRLLFHEGLESAEVARRLDINRGALRVRKHRALSRLGTLLGESESRNAAGGAGTTG